MPDRVSYSCRSCDGPSDSSEVCAACYRDPATNNCVECGQHLPHIPYPYVCGDCITREREAREACTES